MKLLALLTIALTTLLTSLACAEEGKIFLPDQPWKSHNAIVKALEFRHWEIYQNDNEGIRAKVRSGGRQTSADIHIFHRDDQFYYTATATKTKRRSTGGGRFTEIEVEAEVPEFWIQNLRDDALARIKHNPQ